MNKKKRDIIKSFKKKKIVLGTWSHIIDTKAIEAIADTPIDFFILDLEHGPHSYNDVINLITAIENMNKFAFVRIPYNNSSDILRSLDSGAHGIFIPHVSSLEKAETAIQNTLYGNNVNSRGVSTLSKSSLYDFDRQISYLSSENKYSTVSIMIEDHNGLSSIDDILKLKNLSYIFLGTYDLYTSLKMNKRHKNVYSNEMYKLIKDIAFKCKKNGVKLGSHAPNSSIANKLIDCGVDLITLNVDITVMKIGFQKIINEVNR